MRPFSTSCFAIVLFVSLACACSGGSSGGTAPAASSTADLTGSWTANATSIGGFRASYALDIVQSGGSVTGTAHGGSGCIGGGKLVGSVAGDTLSATVTSGAVTISITATITSASEVDGSYDLPGAGACPADRGSFALVRR